MSSHKTRGFLLGTLGSITYGLNPMFALPLYAVGINVASVLFYRYTIAVVLLAIIMWWRHESFKLAWKDVPMTVIAGLLFAFSSQFLFDSYRYMDVGIASTLLFVYPVFVTILMVTIYNEKVSSLTIFSIVLALAGIALLYDGNGDETLNTVGVLFVMGSALSYALYMVMVNRSRLSRLSTLKLSFYALLFGLCVFIVKLDFLRSLNDLPTTFDTWKNIIGLALFPTIISLVTMTIAIHDIGSIPVSILGALEPVTALLIGYALFGEILSTTDIIGVTLVISAVILLIIAKPVLQKMRSRRSRR